MMMMMMMGDHFGWAKVAAEGWRKGPWTAEEDRLLIEYVRVHGEGRWNSVAHLAGKQTLFCFRFSNYKLDRLTSNTLTYISPKISSHGSGCSLKIGYPFPSPSSAVRPSAFSLISVII